MAFLCPSRLGRNKHKQGFESLLERLTEDGNIDALALEDLVKLSWTTPDARRIILQNFTACASHELTVKQGQKVNYIYREGDWAYTVADDKKEGFVPFAFLAKIGAPPKSVPRKIDTNTYTKSVGDLIRVNKASDLNNRKISVESEGTDHSASDVADDSFASTGWSNESFTESESIDTVKERPAVNYLQTEPLTKVPMFYEVFLDERTNILHKNPLPPPDTFKDSETVHPLDDIGPPSPSLLFKVMYNFAGQDVYDVPVKAGEVVYLLDDSDPGWFWVCKPGGSEGYVPSNYIAEIPEDSIDDIETPRRETPRLVSNRNEHTSEDVNFGEHKQEKSRQDELPTNWKLTHELKGKNPANESKDSGHVLNDKKKQRPKKPPRKRKYQQNGLSPRLDDSMDSLDTCITDSSIEYLDYENKSSCDELSPRSCVYSESSVLDSSYTEVYNQSSFGNSFFEELSPRSNNSQFSNIFEELSPRSDISGNKRVYRKRSDRDELPHSGHTKTTRDQINLNEKKSDNSRVVHCNKTPDNKSNRDNRVKENGQKEDTYTMFNQQQKEGITDHRGRQTSDSFESRSSLAQRHKRPLSLPAFKSYQEYKKDYFDEYFYEDNEIKFQTRPKTDVVNVSEILKLRKRNEQITQSHAKENGVLHVPHGHKGHSDNIKLSTAKGDKGEHDMNERKDKTIDHTHNGRSQPKLKPYLLNIPSTQLEHIVGNNDKRSTDLKTVETERTTKSQARKRFYSSADVDGIGSPRNVMDDNNRKEVKSKARNRTVFQQTHIDDKTMKSINRQFSSSVDLRQAETKKSNAKTQKSDANSNSTCVSNRHLKNKENCLKQTKSHLRPYNSSTDLREIHGKPDWSFGYPRKSRQSIGRAEKDTRNSGKNYERIQGKGKGGSRKSEEKRKDLTDERVCTNNSNYFDVRKSRHTSEKDSKTRRTYDDSVLSTDKSNCSVKIEGDMSFNNEDMMALLQQSGDLLQKTGKLLDSETESYYSETEDSTDVTHDMVDNKIVQRTDRLHDTLSAETNAKEKCNIFLENRTIGIHGMTYYITEDSSTNEANTNGKHMGKRNNVSKAILNTEKNDSTEQDIRKEKSNVMKEHSSKIVSDELKFLDLQDIRGITEFVCQCDYEPDTDNMLPIKHGEIVHIGLDGQEGGEWYWAFSPRLRKNGFVPKKFVKIPLVTII